MSRKKKHQKYNYWESADWNERTFDKNFEMLVMLAINRFRWVNLPDTCDARYFERQLHQFGMASFAHKNGDVEKIFTTLCAMPTGEYNMYGIPTKWRAVGFDGQTDFTVTHENGELCYYSNSRFKPWNMLEVYARRLTNYERTEDVNLAQQKTPWVFVAPQEKKLELINLFKQIDGNEYAILGDTGLLDLVNNVTSIPLQSPLISEQLTSAWRNTLNGVLLYLGIPHLATEKSERLIKEEAKSMESPTNLMLLDCLNARRDFCNKVNKKFGLDIQVYFNTDLESYNFNFIHNIQAQSEESSIEDVKEKPEVDLNV